ncbi:nitroreductase [Leclercia adecarboxylata]|uniref:nitroreductase n=1 Tax=Leclercia adecarboxylata TaxID=83655 RepID=UPI00384B7EF8
MEKNFTPEQIEMINRVVFMHIDKMNQKIAEIVEETESAAHQQLQESGIDMTDFSPANKSFLMVTLIQNLIDRVHGGDMAIAQKIIAMEAKRLNVSVNVDADKSRR